MTHAVHTQSQGEPIVPIEPGPAPAPAAASVPARRRVLLVEDNFLVAVALEVAIKDFGYDVVGPMSTLGEALSWLIDHSVDAALLDYDLGGETAVPLATVLTERETPFLYLTGYASETNGQAIDAGRLLRKPVSRAQLRQALAKLFPAGH